MTTALAVPLANQRHQLRVQLHAQRLLIARHLAAAGGVHHGFPRSITMRWLIQEPALATLLVKWVAGERIASLVPTALILLRLLRTPPIT